MKKFFRSIFVGGIMGFIAGLLFAPSKGEETRKKVEEAIKKGKEKFEEVKGTLTKKE
ncbi:MAG: YtxH domain-containing protein [Candidatus Margulisiibacteriota bacterium]